jgi:hypothetical protein
LPILGITPQISGSFECFLNTKWIQKKPPESRMFLQDVTPLPRFEYRCSSVCAHLEITLWNQGSSFSRQSAKNYLGEVVVNISRTGRGFRHAESLSPLRLSPFRWWDLDTPKVFRHFAGGI